MALMLKPDEEVDTSLRLAEMGLDLLMAVEPRRWARQACGLMVHNARVVHIQRNLSGMVAVRLAEETRGQT
ncbi:hypothetical protein VSDG_03240 [Cytospora chrysosperma]|uniref:Uncharacterized protein n=1 Tax=Cytospora chrysosperma TaxID=252740 RepID=A0A423WB95_CYTCH|nr:hypothetical protein VSDG_03240 [Valsa sordida]